MDKQLDFQNGFLKLPLDTQTAWQRSDKQGQYYTLGSLYFMVANKDTKFGDYCREANRLKIPQVNVLDKQEVIDYFTGKLAESQKIDTDLRP